VSDLHLVPRYENGIPLEQVPWFEDRHCLSRLYRWLLISKRRPSNVADFIEKAEENWSAEWAELCLLDEALTKAGES